MRKGKKKMKMGKKNENTKKSVGQKSSSGKGEVEEKLEGDK